MVPSRGKRTAAFYPGAAIGLLSLLTGCSGVVGAPPPGGAGTGGGAAAGTGGSPSTGPGTGGTIGGGGGTGGGAVVVPEVFTPAASRLRRLTTFEYRNSVIALLGAGTQVTTELEPDTSLNNLTSIGAASLSLSQPVTEQFERSALALATSLVADTARRQRVVGCVPAGAADEACLRTFVTNFGRRAFRRPLTADEVNLYFGVGKNAMTTLADFWGGVRFALAGLLQSPSFIYRVEIGAPEAGALARRALDPYELATRLSFLLWSTTPDDTLLDAAASGQLAGTDGLRQQAERLLADARAQESVVRLFSEMLSLAGLDELPQIPTLFPAAASATLGASMRAETQSFVRDLVFARDADYREFFTGTRTFLNAELARLYGITGPTGTALMPTVLPAAGVRAGFLGQASFLALNAKSDNTSPTFRGKFIVETLLCDAVLAPPNDVITELPETDRNKTMREQLKNHMVEPRCAVCHQVMDPMGLALEHFDAVGAYRETDRNMPLDVTGTYKGISFNGARELGQALASSIKNGDGHLEATDCLMRNLFRAATGHLETPGEAPAIRNMSAAFAAGGYKVRGALTHLIASEGFRFVGQPE